MWLKIAGAYVAWVAFGIIFRFILDEVTYNPFRCPSCGTDVTPEAGICPVCSTRLGKHVRGLFG